MKRLSRGLPLLVFALTFLAFLPALNGAFLNWDDSENFIRNEAYRGLGWPQLRWMFTTTLMGHYIPLTWLTLGLNYALGGMNPWGYHLGNQLVHAANATLVFLVACRLLRAALPESDRWAPWGAAVGALVFGVHPLRVESVAWITERRDVLCGFFFLLAVLAYLRAVERPGGAAPRWMLLSGTAFAASLLSKAAAMPLPAVLLLLDVYPLRRARTVGWRRSLLEKAPFAALAGAAAGLSLLALRHSTVVVTGYETYGVRDRIAMTAYSLSFYPWKFVWPVGLSPLYELPPRVEWTAPQFAVPLAAFVLATGVLIALARRWPAGLAAWTYSALMVLPVSGAVHAGHQLAHDRYSYLSGLGFAVLAGAALVLLLRAAERGHLRRSVVAAAAAAAALVVLVLAGGVWRQSRIWHDSETLWRWAVDVDPTCAICANNLGAELIFSPPIAVERAREAEALFRHAIALRPEHAYTYHNLGAALAMQRRYDEAEAAFREYMRRDPSDAAGPARLGMLRVDQGRWAEAIPLLRRALAIDPRFPQLRPDLALALRQEGERLRRQGHAVEADALLREAEGVLAAGRDPGGASAPPPAGQRSTTSAR